MKRIILILLTLFVSCEEFEGSYNLGSNVFLIEGDKSEDRIIVYCTKKTKFCSSGNYIIPISYDNQFHNGKYEEYVKRAISNNNWIIVETYKISTKQKRFWIIDIRNLDKTSAYDQIKSSVFGSYTYKEFMEEKLSRGVELNFDNDTY
ncbi:hypothetical protein [Tenacibaculum sp. 190524A05c]|uniref:hypothetical protein n=1 Tax=Tenacibaculum platacis TaxID=3137852 RepID=UPI0031FAD574